MPNENELLDGLKALDTVALHDLVIKFFPRVREMILNNQGNEEQAVEIFQDSILELYSQVNSDKDLNNYDLDGLLYSIAAILFKRTRKRGSSPLILNVKHYDLAVIKLKNDEFRSWSKKEEEVWNALSEPGRTIMRLTLMEDELDSNIIEHVHFDSEEQLNNRRSRIVDRCKEILSR